MIYCVVFAEKRTETQVAKVNAMCNISSYAEGSVLGNKKNSNLCGPFILVKCEYQKVVISDLIFDPEAKNDI